MNDELKNSINLRIEYIKLYITVSLAIIVGTMTLTNTIYSNSGYRGTLVLGLSLILFSILFCLSSASTLAARHYYHTDNGKFKQWVSILEPNSKLVEIVTMQLSWLFFAIGLVCIGFAIIATEMLGA